jgi:uroporphyrinogen decarboxylase
MNNKENAYRIIKFDRPERVTTAVPAHTMAYLGCNHEGYTGGGHHLPVGSHWTDIWGTTWYREQEGVMGFPRGNPLAKLEEVLPGYRWPDPNDVRIHAQIFEQAKGWMREETFLVGSHRDTIWEKGYMLVGMENLMLYFHTAPAAVRELFHKIMDFQLGIAEYYLKAGVEMVEMSDDLGTQRGPLISPKMVQEFLVPEYRRLFSLYKEHGILVNFHSCGQVTAFLGMFMDLGVDILNPIQATANDLDQVRKVTQNRMALQGGINSATIMSGPVEAIRTEVTERVWQLGQEGGYFCCQDQELPWPDEHIKAMRQAVQQYGHYPLSRP